MSSSLSASISTLPFCRLLKVLIPIFIFVGSTLDFINSFTTSVVWFSLVVTISLYLNSFLPASTSAYCFLLTPVCVCGYCFVCGYCVCVCVLVLYCVCV